MDVLTDVLQSVRLRSQVYGRMELTAPWGLEFDLGDNPHPYFHAVSRGMCWLQVQGEPAPIALSAGDFLLVPRGNRGVLKDHPDSPSLPIGEVIAASGADCSANPILHHGGGGARTSLVNGCFTFEDGGATPLIEALPSIIHVKGDAGEPVPGLAVTLQYLAMEAASPMPGTETIRGRLADILFVQAIRAYLATSPGESAGWLRALTDPQIGKALKFIHDRPGDAWTVESLADRVIMSRSAFAERFVTLVGIPPLKYVTRWRMHTAARMLRSGSTVAQVAYTVGYEAEGSFGKVFKRYTGTSPGEFRVASKRPGNPHGAARAV